MAHDEEIAKNIINKILEEMEVDRRVKEIEYREDYQEYFVLLEDNYFFQLRQKLIDVYDEEGEEDIKRDIIFRIKTAEEIPEDEIFDEPPEQIV